MFKKQDFLFLTFNHPAEQKRKTNRKAVSSFVSRSYRPTSKKIVFNRSNYRPFAQHSRGSPTLSNSSGLSQDVSTRSSSLTPDGEDRVTFLEDRLLGNPLEDPFSTYPIPFEPYIPFFVDYFIRALTPRFTPALDTTVSRYLKWFNVALQHPEAFHALIALCQMYQNIDVNGFSGPHSRALYHRGETLKLLRQKVAGIGSGDDDASILTALWLLDVEYAHDDRRAWAMHKKAKEKMVANRGGIQQLSPELQDELLKSEFFLPVLYHGRFVSIRGNASETSILMFWEFRPFRPSLLDGLPPLFATLAFKRLLTTPVAEILQSLLPYVGCHFPNPGDRTNKRSDDPRRYEELERAAKVADTLSPDSMERKLCSSLLVYIFNAQDDEPGRRPFLEILHKLATEMCSVELHTPFAERECTLWAIVTIGATASSSPWRQHLPFMGHIIEWMANVSDQERLTTMLRGYYLYGVPKEELKHLGRWYVVG